MNSKLLSPLAIALIVGFASCHNSSSKKTASIPASFKNEINPASFDTTIKPQNDFYDYVNAKWLKNNPIPETESSWGSFNILNQKNMKEIRTILEHAAKDKNAKPGSNEQKIGDYYYTAMDSTTRNKQGLKPLKGEFAKIASLKNMKNFPALLAHEHVIGADPGFGFGVSPDAKNSSMEISMVVQDGLTLPSKAYYLNPNPRFAAIRKHYVAFVQQMFGLLGDKPADATKDAKTVMNIETQFAKASMSNIELRNIQAQYNKMSVADLQKLTPNFNWDQYFKGIGIHGVNNIIVGQPDFMKTFNGMLKSVPIKDWKTYLRFHLFSHCASKLTDSIEQVVFNFYGPVFEGVTKMQPRWKRCLHATDRALGMAVGQVYVKSYFSPEAKKKVNEMVDNLVATYKERIKTRPWMSAATKKYALQKLDLITRKLAYPDKWRDYSSLHIKRDSYVLNFLRAQKYEFDYMINKLGKPVDRTEWGMSPQTINAYYNPSMNEIVFPAAIMQPPFFDTTRDAAMNYGCIGAIIGHEMTHGFDDQGSQFDAKGNMNNWWTPQDSAKFHAKTALLVEQSNNYVIDSVHVKGALTLGENIADLGGLTISYHAYHRYLKSIGDSAGQVIDGLTPDQRFFIAFAQGWRDNIRPAAERQRINVDPHSPSKFRVNGPLSNMPEFYKAFNVKKGDSLYRPVEQRAEIW